MQDGDRALGGLGRAGRRQHRGGEQGPQRGRGPGSGQEPQEVEEVEPAQRLARFQIEDRPAGRPGAEREPVLDERVGVPEPRGDEEAERDGRAEREPALEARGVGSRDVLLGRQGGLLAWTGAG